MSKPPATLTISGSSFSAGPGGTGSWSQPDRVPADSYMHHNAAFEMRTNESATEGNQATYDASGNLITSGIMAGTADRFAPYNGSGLLRLNFNHRDNDVYPYIHALQIDGNPVTPTSDFKPTALKHPALHQGANIIKYLECRPTIF